MTREFVTVATFTDAVTAHIALGRLRAEGIAGQLADQNLVSMDWPLSNAVGGVKLQVSVYHADRAREILRAHEAGEFADTEEPEDMDTGCARCGSVDVRNSMPLIWVLFLVLTLGLGIIFPIRRSVHTCERCGHGWRD